MIYQARKAEKFSDAELQKPTTYGIIKDITNRPDDEFGYTYVRNDHNNINRFNFPYSIMGSWFDKSDHIGADYRRPGQFSNPLGLIIRDQCTLSNAMKLPGRICGTVPIAHRRIWSALFEGEGEPQPNFTQDKHRERLIEPVEELQVLAGFRRRSGNQEIHLTDREVAALFRLMIPTIPHFIKQKRGFFIAQYHYRNGTKFDAKLDEVIEPDAYYVPEVLARMLKSDGMLDYKNPEDVRLVNDVDGIMCNIGNAFTLRDGDVNIKWKTAAQLGNVIATYMPNRDLGIRSEIKNKFYSRVANAFGQLAIDAGINRPDFTLKGFQEYLETKVGIVQLMRTLGSMKGKMEGYRRFERFELARADYNTALQLIDRFKQLPTDRLGAEGEKLHAFFNDPDLTKFMDEYRKKFSLAPNAAHSVINTNPELDHLLCRAPETGRFADYMTKQAVTGR
jgi:hypothetical protein